MASYNSQRRKSVGLPLYAKIHAKQDHDRIQKRIAFQRAKYTAASPEIKAMYQTKWWWRARYKKLKEEPFCVICLSQGKETKSQVVDHKVPHRGDPAIFHDYRNLQALCRYHHDSVKAKAEASKGGGADIHGNPLSPLPGW